MLRKDLPSFSSVSSMQEYTKLLGQLLLQDDRIQIHDDIRKYEKTYRLMLQSDTDGYAIKCGIYITDLDLFNCYLLFSLRNNGSICVRGKRYPLTRDRGVMLDHYNTYGAFFRCPFVFEQQDNYIIGLHSVTHERMVLRQEYSYRPFPITTEMYSSGVHNWQRTRAFAIQSSMLPSQDIAPIVEATTIIQCEETGSYDPDRYIDNVEITDIELY